MRNRLSSIIALGLAGFAIPAQASTIVQITASGEVTQDIITLRGDPNFSDTINPSYQDNPFIFFDEHIRILTEEVDVWDPSQIPTAPNAALEGSNYSVISTGMLTGTWTFDADILAQTLTGFEDPDGTVLGETSNVSTFKVEALGVEVINEATSISRVVVANNLLVGEGGEKMDVIAIQADRPDMTESLSNGVTLFLGGDSNWFEDAAGSIPDFSRILAAQVEYEEEVSGIDQDGEVTPLYNELITGDLAGSDLSLQVFGAADGSSETSPLLPDAVSRTEDGAPSFGFDVSLVDTGIVFIDPEIAVGYTYELTGSGEIAAIQAPGTETVDDADGYVVTLPDGTTFTLDPGQLVTLEPGVKSFVLSGIDPSLMLDPLDNTTFVLGLEFSETGDGSMLTQTALVVDTDNFSAVPLPPTALLMLSGLGLFGFAARRRRRAA